MRARILSRMFNSLNQQKQKMNNAKRKEKWIGDSIWKKKQ
jgi:hypothetical protein